MRLQYRIFNNFGNESKVQSLLLVTSKLLVQRAT